MRKTNKNGDIANVSTRTSDYVCVDCGINYLTEKQKESGGQCHTFHLSECGLCQQIKPVTHMRAYNYLRVC